MDKYRIPGRIFLYCFLISFLILCSILAVACIFIRFFYPISWIVVMLGVILTWKGFIYPVQKWILDNVKCPQCEAKVTECKYNYQYKAMMSFKVYCKSCQKVRILETGTFNKILRFKD